MDDFFVQLQKTKELSPADRRKALKPYADNASLSRAFLRLKSGQDTRSILRALLDLSSYPKTAETILRLLKIHQEAIDGLLQNADPKVRKNCAQLLGKLAPDDFSASLLTALKEEEADFVRPSILLALGNAQHSPAVAEALASYQIPPMEEKHRVAHELALKKALASLTRVQSLPLPSAPFPAGTRLLLSCPNAKVATAELAALGFSARPVSSPKDWVFVENAPSFSALYQARSFFTAGVLMGTYPTWEKAVVGAISPAFSHLAHQLYDADDLAYRVEVTADGVEHPFRKQAAEAVALQMPANAHLVNNPSSYQLGIRIHQTPKGCFLLLEPAPSQDKRFSYREAGISASVHPAVAASCMAFLQPYFSPKARVLDCFCGAGTMLFERSRYPYASLTGTDITHRALQAARANERRAKTGAHFLIKNALTPFEKRYDEVLSNMPFGLRVSNHAQNQKLYTGFLDNLKQILAPGGHAFLFTHEKKLLQELIKGQFQLLAKCTFAAGGLYPTVFVLAPLSPVD